VQQSLCTFGRNSFFLIKGFQTTISKRFMQALI
jgi:hypothetical protein